MKNTEKKPSLVEIMSRFEEDDMTYKQADINEIRAAIEAGADVNERSADGKTAFDIATAAGNEKIAALLVKHIK